MGETPCGSKTPVYHAAISSRKSSTDSPTRTVRAFASPRDEPRERSRNHSATASAARTAKYNTITIRSNGQLPAEQRRLSVGLAIAARDGVRRSVRLGPAGRALRGVD